ncbi:MAG TPA: isoprenylcysteine carboxylmethyltransferase family protein [Verrucomicrobiae bacterium]
MPLTAIITVLRALGIWLFLAVVFIGLVLIGVGHGPWNYCWFFAMGCWLLLDTYWVVGTLTTKPIMLPRHYRRAVIVSFMVHAVYCLPLSSVPVLGQQILPHFIPLKILGAFMCATGVSFAMWARHILAGNWNAAVALQQRHVLIRAGPYAIVRHPIYFGFFLMALGMFLALGEVRGLACLAHALQFFEKMKFEEDILRTTYPDEYPGYERRVKRLVPFVW